MSLILVAQQKTIGHELIRRKMKIEQRNTINSFGSCFDDGNLQLLFYYTITVVKTVYFN